MSAEMQHDPWLSPDRLMSGATKYLDPVSSAVASKVAPSPSPAAAPASPAQPALGAAASTDDSNETVSRPQALGSITSGKASTILTSPLGQTGPDENEDLARKALLGG